MRYAAAYKPDSEPLDQFVRRKGGINVCAARTRRVRVMMRPARGGADKNGSPSWVETVWMHNLSLPEGPLTRPSAAFQLAISASYSLAPGTRLRIHIVSTRDRKPGFLTRCRAHSVEERASVTGLYPPSSASASAAHEFKMSSRAWLPVAQRACVSGAARAATARVSAGVLNDCARFGLAGCGPGQDDLQGRHFPERTHPVHFQLGILAQGSAYRARDRGDESVHPAFGTRAVAFDQRDHDPSRMALSHGNGDFGRRAWRDHVELPDSAAELPFACRGGLLVRRFRCNRSGRDRTPYRQEPESGSDHTETTCKTLHRHSETH
jgi:hypothetical protein